MITTTWPCRLWCSHQASQYLQNAQRMLNYPATSMQRGEQLAYQDLIRTPRSPCPSEKLEMNTAGRCKLSSSSNVVPYPSAEHLPSELSLCCQAARKRANVVLRPPSAPMRMHVLKRDSAAAPFSSSFNTRTGHRQTASSSELSENLHNLHPSLSTKKVDQQSHVRANQTALR